MSSAGDALRAGVLANPDDDTLRLVYADWLEENGEPERGQFVRAQVWAARAEPHSPAARQHRDVAKRLFKGRGERWGHHIRRLVQGWQFERGFVEQATVHVSAFPRDAGALFALEPVRRLRPNRNKYTFEPVELDGFLAAPQLARVTHLDLSYLVLAPHEFDQLLACPHWGALTDLSLRNNRVQPDWLLNFLIGPALPALAGLDLFDLSHLGPRLAEALPRAGHRALRRFDAGHVVFTSDQITRVLNSTCVRDAEELRLACLTGTGRAGPLTHLHLGWAFHWKKLRVLDLAGQGVGDTGVAEIAGELTRAKEPVPLRWLGLAHNRLGAGAVRALVNTDPAKVNLYHLDLTGNDLTLAQRAALQARFAEAVIVA